MNLKPWENALFNRYSIAVYVGAAIAIVGCLFKSKVAVDIGFVVTLIAAAILFIFAAAEILSGGLPLPSSNDSKEREGRGL